MDKARRYYLLYCTFNPFADLFGALGIVLATTRVQTHRINSSTGSMSLYVYAAGTAVEGGFN